MREKQEKREEKINNMKEIGKKRRTRRRKNLIQKKQEETKKERKRWKWAMDYIINEVERARIWSSLEGDGKRGRKCTLDV